MRNLVARRWTWVVIKTELYCSNVRNIAMTQKLIEQDPEKQITLLKWKNGKLHLNLRKLLRRLTLSWYCFFSEHKTIKMSAKQDPNWESTTVQQQCTNTLHEIKVIHFVISSRGKAIIIRLVHKKLLLLCTCETEEWH